MGHPVSVAEAVAIESLGQGSRAAAFVLPGGLGVQDGALIAALRHIRRSGRRRAGDGADQAGSRSGPRHTGAGGMAGARRAAAAVRTANSARSAKISRKTVPPILPFVLTCMVGTVGNIVVGRKGRRRGCSVDEFFARVADWASVDVLCGRRAWLRLCACLRRGPRADSSERHDSRLATNYPAVTILKPLHGMEPNLYANLAGFCVQDYPGPVQIVFGVDDPADPAIAVVHKLIADFPDSDLTLVINSRRHGTNRKVSNLINMVRRSAPRGAGRVRQRHRRRSRLSANTLPRASSSPASAW